ncbi:MAG: hypothetical protein WBB45_18365 [Cyclobacteriaceae bacterium]
MIRLNKVYQIDLQNIRGGKIKDGDPLARTTTTDGGTIVTEPPIYEGEPKSGEESDT